MREGGSRKSPYDRQVANNVTTQWVVDIANIMEMTAKRVRLERELDDQRLPHK